MRPTAEMDAGPVCLQRDEPIAPDDTYGTLAPRLAGVGGDLLVEALDTRPPFEEQPDDGVTFADKITAEDRRLDPGAAPDGARAAGAGAVAAHRGVGGAARRRAHGRARARAPPTDEVEPGRLDARDGRLLFGCAGGCARAARGEAARRAGDGRRAHGCAATPGGSPDGQARARPPRAAAPGADAARVCAFRVLERTFGEGAYADRAFRAEADRAGLDARDRAFAQRLAYGAIQNRRDARLRRSRRCRRGPSTRSTCRC